ncbi:MAG: fumarylacetoacetate hydrolase family protein [Thaumarchaeota archaeon]|nr:fumarylacetoacetate hydrolase family protein [Nitrososphaerota archaeon]
MKLCRFQSANGISFGVTKEGWLYDLTGVDPVGFRSLNSAYTKAGSDIPAMLDHIESGMKKARKVRHDDRLLRIPIQSPEIWAAGVTYLRSREARETETKSKGIYDRVYEAARPELFLKDTGLRCRGPEEDVCVRSDSKWSVPEPELTVVFDEEARVVGYTIGNDVSSRDIEGENPLYLPQAKVYRGSSAIGPVIATPDEISDPHKLEIRMKILREGKVAFKGTVSTSQMKRSVPELAEFLKRDNILRRFTLLMTGTSIVPPDDFTLEGGETVEIEIEGIGLLRNPVMKLRK